MREHLQRARNADLMGDDIVGILLTKEHQCNSNKVTNDEAPKLRRFFHHYENIDNVRFLAGGEHGVVVLALIKDQKYVLKVVRLAQHTLPDHYSQRAQFKDWKQPGPVFYPPNQAIHTSPLACESRAFGRLISINENGTWACECHGWMKLSDTQFKTIYAAAPLPNLSRWVIVKEYLPESTNASHVNEIYIRFSIPRQASILPKDVRVENYRGSRIVDLSSTLTAPCPGWTQFEFDFFYKETVNCVFYWFGKPESQSKSQLESQPESQVGKHDEGQLVESRYESQSQSKPVKSRLTASHLLFASTLAFALCLAWRLGDTGLPRRLWCFHGR